MSEQEFIEKLMDVMNTEDEITMDSKLDDIEEWDSLSYVSFLAMCTKYQKKRVEYNRVREAKKVKDLYEIINGEMNW